jgi:hypothetical protein
MPVTIGTHGRAVTPLRPTGYVEVNGSRLEAKLAPSMSASIETGTDVIVVGNDAFGLLVKAANDIANISALTGFGEAVPTPSEQEELRVEQEQQAWAQEQEDIRRSLHTETILLLVPTIIAFAVGSYFFDTPTAIAMSIIWLGLFFGAILAFSWFNTEG